MRHRRCRRVVLFTFHGFALWASPAVTHSVSPLGTVDEHVEAFRLPPPCISRKSVDAHTISPPQQHPHRDTLASGGGVPCLTAGDARRVNPWRRGQRELRRQRRRTASVEGETQMGRGGCCATPLVSESGFVYLPRVRPLGITRGYA